MKFLGVIFQQALTDCINVFAVGDTLSVKTASLVYFSTP